ncbi:MAG: nicotinate (nicotinamide) nucleotide adenylyltransferase [Ruminococcus sp.]|nr:nicotinate (nicotinamide) nucleotide adenylyltransferase [Ruminococcus sp.]
MNIGVYGGTFDPIHKGHARLLELAKTLGGLDKVIVMPDRIPPHKVREDMASPEDRLEMCRLTFAGHDDIEVSDWEIRQEGKSYSVLTLRHLKKLYPEDRLWFIMGSDMLTTFTQWYCFDEILTLAGLICLTRYSGDDAELEAAAEELRAKGGEVKLLPAEAFEVSSSQLRKLIARGENCGEYLERRVREYINSKGLYRKREG